MVTSVADLVNVSPPKTNRCSSSPAQSVGRGGNSTERVELVEPTVRFRGSQKSNFGSTFVVCGIGEGDGESEGQVLVERSSEG